MSLPLATDSAPLLAPGSLVDSRFRVERHLASGGMGDVYQAEHVYMGRKVALKLLRPEWSHDPAMATRFQREAQVVSQLDHPHVVRIFDFGKTQDGLLFLAMELIEGESLEALLLRKGPLPPAEAVDLLLQLCEALGAAHTRGIVHRDLKPDNVILTRDSDGRRFVKVLDFGIARLIEVEASSQVTQLGMVLGTPEYLSPEQALAQPLDQRTDLYSLSVMAYRMLAGALPFAGPTPQEFVSQHIHQAPPPLGTVRRELVAYPALLAAIHRGLSKLPAERFQSAAELGAALALPLPLSSAPPPSAPSSPPIAGAPRGPTHASAALLPSQLLGKGYRSQNLTVVFTDLKDFTARTSHQTREENHRTLDQHNALLSPIFKGYGGRIVKTVGDAFLVTFPAPTDALLCAMAAQDRLAEHNASVAESERLEVRIAASLGEVRVVQGDIFGDPVNLAARVEGITEAGDICFTQSVCLAMNQAEIPHAPLGARMFKGFDAPVEVYRVLRDPAAALPFGGRALEPLRERLRRQARRTQLRESVASGVQRGLQRVSGAADQVFETVVYGSGWRRAAALGALGAALLLSGVWVVHALRAAPAAPSNPGTNVRELSAARRGDERSLDQVLHDAKLAGSCEQQLRNAERLDALSDSDSEPMLRQMVHAGNGTFLEPQACKELRAIARRALNKIDPEWQKAR